ncbi:MAG TPA: hypothetical protein VGR96_19735 [Acidobacteriaceae bacterium]|nr:hypothetical protein [Acidobacteriaceae bacterium]
MKRRIIIPFLLIASSLGAVGAATLGPYSAPQHSTQPAPAASRKPPIQAGERIFQENCARCHTPPMSLPQRITGTVVMHMRVRARLSHKDQQLLLKYLTP